METVLIHPVRKGYAYNLCSCNKCGNNINLNENELLQIAELFGKVLYKKERKIRKWIVNKLGGTL